MCLLSLFVLSLFHFCFHCVWAQCVAFHRLVGRFPLYKPLHSTHSLGCGELATPGGAVAVNAPKLCEKSTVQKRGFLFIARVPAVLCAQPYTFPCYLYTNYAVPITYKEDGNIIMTVTGSASQLRGSEFLKNNQLFPRYRSVDLSRNSA